MPSNEYAENFTIPGIHLIATQHWVCGHAGGLSWADAAWSSEATIFDMWTCCSYAVNKNTVMRRGLLLLVISVTHCRRTTFQALVNILFVGFFAMTRCTYFTSSDTGPAKQPLYGDIRRMAVTPLILWAGITSCTMPFLHIVGLRSSLLYHLGAARRSVRGFYTFVRHCTLRTIPGFLWKPFGEIIVPCRIVRVLRCIAQAVFLFDVDCCAGQGTEIILGCCWSCIGGHSFSGSFSFRRILARCQIFRANTSMLLWCVLGASSTLPLVGNCL